MLRKQALSKLIYICTAFCLLASLVVLGCSKETPTPATTASTANVAKTPASTTEPTSLTKALSAKQPQYGGTLRVLDMNQGSSFGYPVKMSPLYGNKQADPAIESLVRTDTDGNPIPWLATGWTIAADNLSITFTLRQGVKFHDGTDFNAAAAKWNLDQFLAAKYAGTSNIKSIDIVDNYTIRMNLSKWDNTILNSMTTMIGLVISPTAFQKNGEQWCETHPVGTGPFEFVSYTPDVDTVYKKFDNYWQAGKPYLDGVDMRVILDMTTREYSFRHGDGDVVLMMSSDQVLGLEKDGYPFNDVPTWLGIVGMVTDSANPQSPWSKLEVRQAAMYAIDDQAMVSGIFAGNAMTSNQWSFKGHWSYDPSIVGYPYNPAKAKQLLASAGYPNGFETQISFVTDRDMDRIFAAVQNYLGQVGIKVTLNPMEAPKWAAIALGGGTWNGLIYATPSSDPDFTNAFATAFGGSSTWYKSMLFPQDLVQAIQSATSSTDTVTEQDGIHNAMKLLIDKYCMLLPLVQGKSAAITQKNVHDTGFQSVPNGNLWTPADAWIEK